jgi:hypothetical protein
MEVAQPIDDLDQRFMVGRTLIVDKAPRKVAHKPRFHWFLPGASSVLATLNRIQGSLLPFPEAIVDLSRPSAVSPGRLTRDRLCYVTKPKAKTAKAKPGLKRGGKVAGRC